MAKKRLKIKDKQGNIVNYDISSASVTIDAEGKTLDVKLTELVAAIQAAVNAVVYNGVPHYVNNSMVDLGNQIQPDWAESSTGYPSFIRNKPDVVTGIKVGDGGETITPTGGIITLPNSGGQVTDADTEMSDTSENAVQNKVIKAYVDSLISGLIDGAPQALDTLNELAAALGDNSNFASAITQQLATKQDSLVAGNGITIAQDGKTVSVDAEVVQPVTADGTFAVRIGNNTYTINLNHTHENMAKLEKHTPATMPDAEDMEDDTIYAEIEDGEVNVLYIGGIPFYGGGGAVSGPVLRRPADGSTINMGETENGSVNKAIKVKGKNLTQALTIELDGTGYTFGNTQPSGVTIVNNTELTITAAAANALNGVDIVVVYTGSDTDENASGTLGITSGTPDNVSVEATLVANRVVIENLAGVKLTGTQWLQTDYKPNDKTEFTLNVKFTPNSHTEDYPATGSGTLLQCPTNSVDGKKFRLYLGGRNSESVPKGTYMILLINESSVKYGDDYQFITYTSDTNQQEYLDFIVDHSIIQYAIEPSNGRLTFSNTSTNRSCITSKKTSTMENNMMIGKSDTEGILTRMDVTIYSLEIREQGNVVRRYTAKRRNGVPHLYEEVTGTFLRSETAKVSGLAADELVAVE